MSCFNFIIMKVNGADVSNLPYEDAIQLFLNAEEPIIVEVRRKCLNENNELSVFNYDDDSPYKSPTLAVIASSSSISSNVPLIPHARKNVDGVQLSSSSAKINEKPSNSSISCQTDLSAFDGESKETVFMKSHNNPHQSGIVLRTKSRRTTTTDIALDEDLDDYLQTEFDFEEITLKKSKSAENLGFTISYSTDDFQASDSGTDEYEGECINRNRKLKDDIELNLLDDKCAPRCKIYISDIIPNSLADQDGRLRQGDRILQINGQNVLEKIDPDKLLKENKYSVKILVSRYAFGGDDDFLDSAVYCDDKECQEDKHISSIYEYEQNTFSSSAKSSYPILKLDQTISNSATTDSNNEISTSTTCQILPLIATAENVCDIFSHANIKVQLETVSKEISLLNSQISVMKQLQTETSSISLDKRQKKMSSSSPIKVKKKTAKLYSNKKKTDDGAAMQQPTLNDCSPSPADKDVVEHIYETIPEDADSDVYYCSPYEGVTERRVEEWLKSIGCPNSNINSGNIDKNIRTEIHPVNVKMQKPNNSILDDYDNSSSAYNTGGSCSSAFLALESKTRVDYQNDRQNSRTLVSKSTHSSEKYETFIQSNQQRNSVCRVSDISTNNKYRVGIPGTQTPSIIIPFKIPSLNTDAIEAASTTVDSDGHSTLVAKSSVYRLCHSKVIDEYKEKDMNGMVWKVKRRPDGSRYIVRRLANTQSTIPEKNHHENSPIQPESASAINFDYKRQFNRVKDRNRSRHHKSPAIPSKEKTHSQHWLV